MNKKINIKLLVTSVLALGAAAITASAQDAVKSTQPPANYDSGYGLIGTNYIGADFGYTHSDHGDSVLHDYDATFNQNVLQHGITGLDAAVDYGYLSGNSSGGWTRRQDVALAFTGYLLQPWGKPFITADAGYDWQRSAGIHSHSYQYGLGTGVEFQILKPLVFTPFVSYDAVPRIDTIPATELNRFDWNYGGKFTYRLDHDWSVSLGASLDRDRDVTYKGGVQYHF